jgi:hypothetical protein
MIYKVARNGEEIGEFTEEELLDQVEIGKIELDDELWTEGMAEWVPVATMVEEDEEEAPADPPIAEAPVVIAPVHAAPVTPAIQAPVARAQPAVQFMPTPVVVQTGIRPGQYGVPGSAIASLVLGILGFMCGLFSAIPAIICGHLALGKIRRSTGAFGGQGIAIAGVVLGYVLTVASVVGAIVWFITWRQAPHS